MVTSGQLISMDDMDALATLANAKLAPSYNPPYQFARFDATIAPPTDLIGVIVPGTGYFGDGSTVIIRVYSYNTVAGRKIYSQQFAQAYVTFDTSGDPFDIDWSWTAPASAPTGYVAVLFTVSTPGDCRYYQLVATTGFADDGTGWLDNSPLSFGQWRRELLRLREDLFLGVPTGPTTRAPLAMIPLANDMFVSGPWCVAVGPVLDKSIKDMKLFGYRDVKFVFNDDDAPSGILIETTNAVASTLRPPYPPVNSATHTYPLTIYPTTGHIQIVVSFPHPGGAVTISSASCATGTYSYDPVTWELTIDFDAVVGTVYDCTVTANYVASFSSTQIIPFVATQTIADVTTSADDVAILASGTAKSAVCDDAFLLAETVNDPTISAATKIECSEVVRTETNGVDGVWVAKTLPVWAVQTFLDPDLPQYWKAASLPTDRLNAPDSGDINPALSGNNRSALWPVFRDTEFGRWKTDHDGGLMRPVPYWQLDPFHQFQSTAITLAPNTDSALQSLFLASNLNDWQLDLETSGLTIYVKRNGIPDPDVPASYDFAAAGGFKLSDLATIADWQGKLIFFVIRNDTLATESFDVRQFVSLLDAASAYPGDAPIFFATETDGAPALETFSYPLAFSYANPSTRIALPVPRKGYCVYEIVLRRAPVDNGSGIALAPATGTADLDVTLGMMIGSEYGAPGTFTPLEVAFTIPAGQAELRAAVFWPVLSGAPLAYQCAESVQVFPLVNFQPFASVVLDVNADAHLSTFSGKQHFGRDSHGLELLQFNDIIIAPRYFLLPVCAPIYNDMEAVLNLLP